MLCAAICYMAPGQMTTRQVTTDKQTTSHWDSGSQPGVHRRSFGGPWPIYV